LARSGLEEVETKKMLSKGIFGALMLQTYKHTTNLKTR